MTHYEVGVKIAQRALYGYLHHSQMFCFFELLKMDEESMKHKKHAIDDAKMRFKIDKWIIDKTKQIPLYTADVRTVVSDISGLPYEQIKKDKLDWVKKGIEASIRYERATINILDTLKDKVEEVKDDWLSNFIEEYKEAANKEIEENERELKSLQEHGDKYLQKGESKMARYDNYRDDYKESDNMGYMRGDRGDWRTERLERLDKQDESDSEMGWRRHFPWHYFPQGLPFYMEDDLDYEMEMQRGRVKNPATDRRLRRNR